MKKAVDLALTFIISLDNNELRTASDLCISECPWWVDTGWDRALGIFDRGSMGEGQHPWPLHGEIPIAEKFEILESISAQWPNRIRQTVYNNFADDHRAVVEVDSYGVHSSGAVYRNRHAYVIDVENDKIVRVRDYLDTEHEVDIYSDVHVDRRSEAPELKKPTISPRSSDEEIAVAFADALDAADGEGLFGLCSEEATWWADTGTDREAGERDRLNVDEYSVIGTVPIECRRINVPHLKTVFSDGWQFTLLRLTSGQGHVAVEAVGDGRRPKGTRYQNRYCIVLRIDGGKIAKVREYADTRHIFDVFDL